MMADYTNLIRVPENIQECAKLLSSPHYLIVIRARLLLIGMKENTSAGVKALEICLEMGAIAAGRPLEDMTSEQLEDVEAKLAERLRELANSAADDTAGTGTP